MSEGISLLSEGAAALSEATQRDDVRAMEQAGATIGQGLSRLESGLAARRGLESGEPPPQVALEWFKTQLNLLPAHVDSKDTRILGMTPFELFLCTPFRPRDDLVDCLRDPPLRGPGIHISSN